MRIGIIGAGNIGSLLGALLTAAGEDVTLVEVRPDVVAAIREAGVRIDTVVPSVPGTAAFGFDVANDYIAGFDTGSWVRDAEAAMIEELSA